MNKPVDQLSSRTAQFLQILAAENEGLVTIDIHIQRDSLRALTQDFYTAYLSDSQSETDRAWNKIREDVVVEALQNHLLPMGARWTKDWLKEAAEDNVCSRAASKLEQRVDVAPFVERGPNGEYLGGHKKGDIPKVLAISAGRGEAREDYIHTVVLSSKGTFVARDKLREIKLETGKDELVEIIKRHRPDVIVVGGFTPATHRIKEHVELTIALMSTRGYFDTFAGEDAMHRPPVVWCHDDVARLYQHSKRAATEFAGLNTIERYCLGLARYMQDPLCEYAALGEDIVALSFEPNQRLVGCPACAWKTPADATHAMQVPKEKLLTALQSALVNFVNVVGVDINKALGNEYYGLLLPYVAGLGPRKASGMVRRIKAVVSPALERTVIYRS